MNPGVGEKYGEQRRTEGLRGDRQRRAGGKTEGDRVGEPQAGTARDARRREPEDRSEGNAARGRRRGAGLRLNRSLFWRRTEGLSSRPWESGGRARAAAMWTVISRIRAGGPGTKGPSLPARTAGSPGQRAGSPRGARGRRAPGEWGLCAPGGQALGSRLGCRRGGRGRQELPSLSWDTGDFY